MLTVQEIYRLGVEAGIEADQRPREEIDRRLGAERDKYDKLRDKEKERFDTERLSNPFADTRILHGDPGTEVSAALVGIDIGPAEVMLAERLRSRGENLDLVIAHHPQGRALAGLADVISVQTDLWAQHGSPIGQVESVFAGRIKDVATSVMAANHNRAVDAARLLDVPLMCIHTPADNCVVQFLTNKIKNAKPLLLADVLDLLLEIDEYSRYAAETVEPKIIVGSKENRAGEVFVDMTGGTSGPKDIYEIISKSTNISTLVCMHVSLEHKKEIEKHHLNCIVAPHMPSDTIGLNLILDSLESRGGLNVLECSGFRRVKRSHQ